ncbi:hypothetical protein, partial [Paratractidigestivibacter sp.]|uniref:hypothetical protein n=1 Tax=Paratractidigestivibacter sp. TaxID=2847316 RepID=UPI002AC92F72
MRRLFEQEGRRKPAASKRVRGEAAPAVCGRERSRACGRRRPAAGARVRACAGASRPRRLKGTEGVAFLTSVQVDQAKASLR